MDSFRTMVLGKQVFLLTGVTGRDRVEKPDNIKVMAPEKLLETARRNPDAVAFGFISGSWVASA